MITVLLPFLLGIGLPTIAPSTPAQVRFEADLAGICAKYAGQPMYEADGRTEEVTCDWVQRKGTNPSASGENIFRRAFAVAPRLVDMRVAFVPREVACPSFVPAKTATGTEIRCHADIDGLRSTIVYSAGPDGRLSRIVMAAPLRENHRRATRRTVERGTFERVHDAFADASAEIVVARMRLDAHPGDTIEYDGTTLVITSLREPVGTVAPPPAPPEAPVGGPD